MTRKLEGSTRPRWQGNIRSSWNATPALELGAILRFNGDFLDSSVPTRSAHLLCATSSAGSAMFQIRTSSSSPLIGMY